MDEKKPIIAKRSPLKLSFTKKASTLACSTGFIMKELVTLPIKRIGRKNHYNFRIDFMVRVSEYAMGLEFDKFRYLFLLSTRALPWSTVVEECDYGHWVGPKIDLNDPQSQVILYVHGGGYCAGDSLQYMDIFAIMLKRFKKPTRILSLDYPLAPESPYPAQVEFFMAAYKDLLQFVSGSQIILMGESAGGHCVLNGLVHLENNGIELPKSVVAISPSINPTIDPRDMAKCPHDYVTRKIVENMVTAAYGPNYQKVQGINLLKTPPLVMQNLYPKVKLLVTFGGVEMLAPQVKQYVKYVEETCGEDALTVDVDEDMPHIYQCLPLLFGKRGKDGLDRILNWLSME